MADPTPTPAPTVNPTTVVANVDPNVVSGALRGLTDPRAFLLFIFLILCMLEYMSYLRSTMLHGLGESMIQSNQGIVDQSFRLIEQCIVQQDAKLLELRRSGAYIPAP